MKDVRAVANLGPLVAEGFFTLGSIVPYLTVQIGLILWLRLAWRD